MKSSKKRSDGSKYRINDQIEQNEVRLIAENGDQLGIVSIAEALAVAREAGLDLVEIAADAEPPVCRIMDYGKHLFEEKKKRAGARKRQKQTQVKEIKFRPTTEEGDYKVKLKNLIRFLEDGDKAKVTMRFRGRELSHQDIGERLIGRVKDDLEPYGTVEQEPKFEGRQIVMVLSPKKR